MAKVTGFGGAFLRAKDPKALFAWYEQHLGLSGKHGTFVFPAATQTGAVAFSFFSQTNDYFPTTQPAMINLQVDDLHALLDRLASIGVAVDPKRDTSEFGSFGWITDPEGNRVELWQAAPKG